MRALITGGTVFVSRYIAEHYVAKGYEVYVLNRNSKAQSAGVKLIQADRHSLGDALRPYHFDIVIDTAYTADDVDLLLDALESYDKYILISSSAVYPDDSVQPIVEESKLGNNRIWRKYGTDKIGAEAALMHRNPSAYILRPPYLYGPMNNLYREAFVFDCALTDRPFYLPKDGKMKLQFFHIHDLCRFIDILLEKSPNQHIFNVGNKELISVHDWVELCYGVVGKKADFINVYDDIEQRNYFCFYPYEYCLDVSKQYKLMSHVKALESGFIESFEWYRNNMDKVKKKPYFEYISRNLSRVRSELP